MPLRIGTPLPELTGATQWLNGEVKREDLIGAPTLIHFWAKSCYICHNNMPTVEEWRSTYAEKGLKVVAIHAPRQEEDTDLEAVAADAQEMRLHEPCAIDNEHTLKEAFQNDYWPAYFLFDQEGNMRSRSAGDAGLKMLEGALKRLMETDAP